MISTYVFLEPRGDCPCRSPLKPAIYTTYLNTFLPEAKKGITMDSAFKVKVFQPSGY
jgi:hypothetical protein